MAHVSFTAMENGTADDYALVDANDRLAQRALPGRLLGILRSLADDAGVYQVSRLEHSLQCATRAAVAGADDDWIFAALLHDIGDVIAPDNHSAAAATVVAPYVRSEVEWVIRTHGIFQGFYYWHHVGADPNAREQYRDSPYFEHAVAFCHLYDQCSFDPTYPSRDLGSFRELLERVCARTPFAAEPARGLEAMGIGETERCTYRPVLEAVNR